MSALTLHPSTSFGDTAPAFAGTPAEYRHGSRDAVRLLVARATGIAHRRFHDLVDELRPGDALVVNTSATVNGEIDAVGWHPISDLPDTTTAWAQLAAQLASDRAHDGGTFLATVDRQWDVRTATGRRHGLLGLPS